MCSRLQVPKYVPKFFDASLHYLPLQLPAKLFFFPGSLLSCHFFTSSITFWYRGLGDRLLKLMSPFVHDLSLPELKVRRSKQLWKHQDHFDRHRKSEIERNISWGDGRSAQMYRSRWRRRWSNYLLTLKELCEIGPIFTWSRLDGTPSILARKVRARLKIAKGEK
jgi:hypothetical protein